MRRAAAILAVGACIAPAAAGAADFTASAPRANWRQAPAYTFTVAPYGGTATIPASVCPFGISDLAATRGRRELSAPRVDTLAFAAPRLIVNGNYRTLRGWVWCG